MYNTLTYFLAKHWCRDYLFNRGFVPFLLLTHTWYFLTDTDIYSAYLLVPYFFLHKNINWLSSIYILFACSIFLFFHALFFLNMSKGEEVKHQISLRLGRAIRVQTQGSQLIMTSRSQQEKESQVITSTENQLMFIVCHY